MCKTIKFSNYVKCVNAVLLIKVHIIFYGKITNFAIFIFLNNYIVILLLCDINNVYFLI